MFVLGIMKGHTTFNFKMTLNLLKIQGQTPLKGEIRASGAKNAMTKLLVASMLSDKKCVFYNVPNILDVEITASLCEGLGMEISWDKEKREMEVQTKELKNSLVPQRFSGANRIPILVIGALIARTTEPIIVPTVGGDLLGKRPVDFHFQALRKLGVEIEYKESDNKAIYHAQAKSPLQGTIIELDYPSVGATENTILASVKAKGMTLIKNAAIEPEIIDLILFLQKLGVDIRFDVNRTIRIFETKAFYPVQHTVLSDRNEIVSYALAAISTKGSVFIKGAKHRELITFLNKIRKVGANFSVKQDGIHFFHSHELTGGLQIETDVHPGFMTDWQQPFAVLLTQCKGVSVIHETVYEKRFGYIEALKKMGADVSLFTECLGNKTCRFASHNHKHSLIVKGSTPLFASNIHVPDLRAGFAYVMASLIAKGTSTITGVNFLDRGYANLVENLTSLGANIERVSESSQSPVSV